MATLASVNENELVGISGPSSHLFPWQQEVDIDPRSRPWQHQHSIANFRLLNWTLPEPPLATKAEVSDPETS